MRISNYDKFVNRIYGDAPFNYKQGIYILGDIVNPNEKYSPEYVLFNRVIDEATHLMKMQEEKKPEVILDQLVCANCKDNVVMFVYDDKNDFQLKKSKFCPNCGQKLRWR